MSETHQIDQLFRDGLYSREITYDPKEWLNAKEMLDEHYRGRNYRRFFKYLLALLLLVSSAVFINQNLSDFENNTKQDTKSGMAVNDESFSGETDENLFHSDDDISSTMKDNKAHENDKIDLSSKDDDSQKSDNSSANFVSAGPILKQKATVDTVTPASADELSNNAIDEPALMSDAESSDVPNELAEEDMFELKDDEQLHSEMWLASGIVAAHTSDDVQKESEYQESITSERLESETPQSNEMLLTEPELESMTLLPLVHEFTDDLPLEEVEEMPGIGKDKSKDFKTTGFKLILGGGLTNHDNFETRENITDYSIFLGIGYEKLLKRNLSAEVRLIFSRRNAFDLAVQSEQTQYGLGFESEFSRSKFNSLDYLELPIFVNYFIHPLHQIGAGLQINYALAQGYDQISYSQNSFTPVDSINMIPAVELNRESYYKPTSVINRFDLSFIFYYHYSLNERMKIGAGLQLGMMDVLSSQYSLQNNYRNNQLRVNLTYRLFD